jgi:hypothetical protein
MATDPNAIAPPNDPLQTSNPPGINGGLINSTGAAQTPPTSPVSQQPIAPVAGYSAATATPQQAGSTGYTPTPYAVDPNAGTVQGRIKSLVEEDSPLMQQAKALAAQQMNSRGLLNSTINTGAAQQAVIAQALPIAQADAAATNTAMTNTANAQNTASNFGAAAANTAQTVNAQLVTALNQTNANAVNTALSAQTQAQNARAIQAISSDTQTQLAVLQSQNQQLLQTDVNAANMFSQVVQAIANIQTNTTLDSNAKSAAVASQLNLLNEGLRTTQQISHTNQAAIASLNLSQFFSNPSGLTGAAAQFVGANGQYFPSQAEANQSFVQAGIDQANAANAAQQQMGNG